MMATILSIKFIPIRSSKIEYVPGGGVILDEPTVMTASRFAAWMETRMEFATKSEYTSVPRVWEQQFEHIALEIENGATIILEDNGENGFGWHIFQGPYEMATSESFLSWANEYQIDTELLEQTLENIEAGIEVLLFEDGFFDMSSRAIFKSEEELNIEETETITASEIIELNLPQFQQWVHESLQKMIDSRIYTVEEIENQRERYENVLEEFKEIEGITFLISEDQDELWGLSIPVSPMVLDYEEFKDWTEQRLAFEAELGETEPNLQRLRVDFEKYLELIKTEGGLKVAIVMDYGELGYGITLLSEEYINLQTGEGFADQESLIQSLIEQETDEEILRERRRKFQEDNNDRFIEENPTLHIQKGTFWSGKIW